MITQFIEPNNDLVIEGINITADIIKSTMGAKGKFVTIMDEDGILKVTKDGVSVAESIILDGLRDIGRYFITSAAKKTVSVVGDGTTGTSVLLQALVNKAKLHSTGDINNIIKGMELAVQDVLEYVKNSSLELAEDYDKLEQVASIASNSKQLGKLIADCYREISTDSLITLEKSAYSPNTYYDIRQGIEFSSGMVHSAFSNKEGERCIYEDARIFIEPKEIRVVTDALKSILEHALNTNEPVIIIAPSFSKQFISTCLYNKKHSNTPVCLIKSPGFGDNIGENYKDIAAYSDKGKIDKIVITREKFIIYNEPTESLKLRLEELDRLLEIQSKVDEYESQKTFKRIHRLKGSTGIIYTGGVTIESQDEEYDRLEDALGSVRASIRNGYVPGGGTVLYKASKQVSREGLTESELIGYKIVTKACEEPIRTILNNANLQVDVVLNYFETNLVNQGYDVLTESYQDMVEAGIIDPTEVVLESLTNAFASTKLLMNTKYNLINK